MFALAPDGYRALGFTDTQLPTPDDRFNPPFGARYFRPGMKGQATHRAPARQRSRRVELGAALPADDPRDGPAGRRRQVRLDTTVADVTASLAGVFEVLTAERGARLTRTVPRGALTIEHFGFQDGVSQPLMIKQDIDAEVAQRGRQHWDPQAPLSLALLRESGGGLGSFLVFRKLEQDVKGFWDALDDWRNRTGVDRRRPRCDGRGPHPRRHAAGADHNGRRRRRSERLPLRPRPRRAAVPVVRAHPQDQPTRRRARRYIAPGTAEFERARRIVRRGITYGKRPDLADPRRRPDRPTSGVGLLFMCFQGQPRPVRDPAGRVGLRRLRPAPASAWTRSSVSTPIRCPRRGPGRHGDVLDGELRDDAAAASTSSRRAWRSWPASPTWAPGGRCDPPSTHPVP